jgi:oligopeptide transport system substrate-binding protein
LGYPILAQASAVEFSGYVELRDALAMVSPMTLPSRFPTLALALGLGVALAGTGCKPRLSSVQEGNRTQVLHYGSGVEPGTIDPQRNTGSPEAVIINELFDSLVVANPENITEVLPRGAERWEVSADGLEYTFHLRRDGRWSNGDPVTAGDYRASIVRLLEPRLLGELANLAYPIAGAEDYHRGRSKDPATIGVTTDGPHVLRFRLRAPLPHFLNFLETYPFVAVHRASLEAHGGWLNPASPWMKPGAMVSNGPFRLKAWVPNRDLVLERNPFFREAARVTLREIHFHPIESIDTEERAFRAGQLHVTSTLPANKIPIYRAENPSALHIAPRFGISYLNLNTEKPPLTDPRVRRALALAINRAQLTAKVLARGEPPAYSFGQPAAGGYQPRHRLEENPAEARRLLAAAGFPNGAGFPRLSYLYNTNERNRDVAQALQQIWRRELGLDIELKNEEWKVFLDSRHAGRYDLARAGWNPFTPEAAELFLLCHSTSDSNDSRWRLPAYDRQYDLAVSTVDRAERYERYQELDRLLIEHMPVIPLAYVSTVHLVDPAVRGWRDNLRDSRELARLSLGPGTAP